MVGQPRLLHVAEEVFDVIVALAGDDSEAHRHVGVAAVPCTEKQHRLRDKPVRHMAAVDGEDGHSAERSLRDRQRAHADMQT